MAARPWPKATNAATCGECGPSRNTRSSQSRSEVEEAEPLAPGEVVAAAAVAAAAALVTTPYVHRASAAWWTAMAYESLRRPQGKERARRRIWPACHKALRDCADAAQRLRAGWARRAASSPRRPAKTWRSSSETWRCSWSRCSMSDPPSVSSGQPMVSTAKESSVPQRSRCREFRSGTAEETGLPELGLELSGLPSLLVLVPPRATGEENML